VGIYATPVDESMSVFLGEVMQMFSKNPSILWLSVTFVKGGEHLNPFDLHTWAVLLSNMFSFNKAIYHQLLFISALCPPAEQKQS